MLKVRSSVATIETYVMRFTMLSDMLSTMAMIYVMAM